MKHFLLTLQSLSSILLAVQSAACECFHAGFFCMAPAARSYYFCRGAIVLENYWGVDTAAPALLT
jgi:hypothetical protein